MRQRSGGHSCYKASPAVLSPVKEFPTGCSFVTDLRLTDVHNSPVTPESLTRTVNDFLAEAYGAVVLEDGAVAFDLAQAKYSISGEYNTCLLHLWSAERNAVRRVLDAEVRSGTLYLAVQRLGQSRRWRLAREAVCMVLRSTLYFGYVSNSMALNRRQWTAT